MKNCLKVTLLSGYFTVYTDRKATETKMKMSNNS